MTIKGFVKEFYRELFWMGVGACVAVVGVRVYDYIREQRESAELERRAEEMLHHVRVDKDGHIQQDEEACTDEFLDVEKEGPDIIVDEGLGEETGPAGPVPTVPCPKPASLAFEEITEDEFLHAPSENRVDISYSPETGEFTDEGDTELTDAEIRRIIPQGVVQMCDRGDAYVKREDYIYFKYCGLYFCLDYEDSDEPLVLP